MAGRIEMYVIKDSSNIPYLVEETKRILSQVNGHGPKSYMGVYIQDEETANAYKNEVNKDKSLSLIGLAKPSKSSFLVRLIKETQKKGENGLGLLA